MLFCNVIKQKEPLELKTSFLDPLGTTPQYPALMVALKADLLVYEWIYVLGYISIVLRVDTLSAIFFLFFVAANPNSLMISGFLRKMCAACWRYYFLGFILSRTYHFV